MEKLKSETLTKEDRLSSLPDALLTHILSYLSTKNSVCTSVLSTNWKYLFASVPALSFHCHKRETAGEFVKFVNKVLFVHNVSCIRSFELFVDIPCHVSDVYSWILAAIRRNARRIEVNAILTQRPLFLFSAIHQTCPLPLELFTHQMLVHLELDGDFVFGVIDTVCLPNLKTLIMRECKISDGDSARRLFSSCVVLEELTIYSCGTRGIKVMSISVPSLKSLTIYCKNSGCEWELNVPNLEYLRCKGVTAKWSSVGILKSLHKADIHLEVYNEEYNDKISELVNKFDEVRFLSLTNDSMQSLEWSSASLPDFDKLTTLELEVKYCPGWDFFVKLLNRAPYLELLVILQYGFVDDNEDFPEIDIFLSQSIPLCFSSSLKEVKLCWFEGDELEYEFEYEWLRYLLKNAKVLEKLTVCVPILTDEEYFAYLERQYVIRKRLLAFPRGLKTCEIVIRET